MLQNNLCDFTKLQNFFYQNVFNITKKLKTVPIVWQDVFDEHVRLDPNVIVQITKNNHVSTMSEVSTYFVQKLILTNYLTLFIEFY